jgi:hypothetical protein
MISEQSARLPGHFTAVFNSYMKLPVSDDMARNRTILAHVSAEGPVLSLVYTTTAELPRLLSFITKFGTSSTPLPEPQVSHIFYVHDYKHGDETELRVWQM